MNLEKWELLKEKTAGLSVRERGIFAATCVVLVIVIWLQVIYTGIEKQKKVIDKQKSQLVQKSITQSDRLIELSNILAHDPNASLRDRQVQLNKDLLTLRGQIEGRLSHLIAPEKMADVMRQVLSDYKGLTLLSARNLPVEPLQINSKSETQLQQRVDVSGSQTEPQAVIFAHGFEIVLSGQYFQTLEFLQRLESISGFYWRALSYEVGDYPNAEITLELSTLSLEEDWIGV